MSVTNRKRCLLHIGKVNSSKLGFDKINSWVQGLAILICLGLKAGPLCPIIWYQIKGALFFCWSSSWPPDLDSQYLLGPKTEEPRYACMSESKASHSHKMWNEVSSSAAHLLHKGLLVKPIKLRWLLRVLCPVRRPIRTLYCVLLKDNNVVFLVRLGPEISFRVCL
jgi:hypothetical protein